MSDASRVLPPEINFTNNGSYNWGDNLLTDMQNSSKGGSRDFPREGFGREDRSAWRESYGRRRHEQEHGTINTRGHDSRGGRGRGRGRGRGGGIPPGLKGREIGMYYRELSMKRKEEEQKNPTNLQTVSLGLRKEQEISNMFGITHQADPSIATQHSSESNSFHKDLRYNPMHQNGKQEISTISQLNKEDAECAEAFKRNFNASSSLRQVSDDNFHRQGRPRRSKSDHNICLSSESIQDVKYLPTKTNANDCLPSTSDHKSTDCTKWETKSEPDVFAIEDSFKDKKENCIPLNSIKTTEPECIDIEMEVEEQYSHLSDSVFKRDFLQSITGSIETNLEKALARKSVLTQNKKLDEQLKSELIDKQQNSKKFKIMMDFRRKLPAFEKQRQILELINQNQVVVISGETGCGKTTQVGQFILDDFILRGMGSTCHVVCTQPRRISATSVSQRVADERDEVLGARSVGYHIRLDRKIPRKQGSIVFCTTGVMLQWMLTNPGLTNISHLILDEIHERDVTSDFVITLLKSVLMKRPDIKVILMSATLNADQFSKYYGNCPYINIPGFTFPVEEFYLEDVLEMTKFEFTSSKQTCFPAWKKHTRKFKEENKKSDDFEEYVLPYVRHLESSGKFSKTVIENLRKPESEEITIDLIAELIHVICRTKGPGAILVFLPGWDQISKVHTVLQRSAFFSSSRFLIIPLHSLMPTTVQRSVFDRPPSGVRKIILATNIAETSITIDDVVFVINSGKIKMKNFDIERNISTLKPEWVSLANARQRKGRAGRVQDGVCYHLYTKGREMTLASYPLPEMMRTTLEEVILQIKILQIGFATPFLLRVMDPPDPRAVELSLKMLKTLNAIDNNENLTPLGYHLAKLPMDPQTGKMILMAAIFSCVDPVLCVAAGLNFKDPFMLPLGKEHEVLKKKLELSNGSKSDHLVLAEAMWRWEDARQRGNEWEFCREFFLSHNTLKLLVEMKAQLANYLHEMNFLSSKDPMADDANRNSTNINLVKAIICAGLYPNVALIRTKQRRSKPPLILLHTPEDGRVQLHIRSINEKETNFDSKFLLYHQKLKSSGIYIHDSTMIHPLPLLFFGEGVNFRVTNGCEMIYVNEHIFFKCKESTANIVKLLRKKLDWILENKIANPGTIDWNDKNKEAIILREIIDIITTETESEVIEID